MRITYRNTDNLTYWTNRWAAIPADLPMSDTSSYPLRYSELVVRDKASRILEAGCGAGRIVRHYHERGFSIVGVDFVPEAIQKLRTVDASLNVEIGDIAHLQFEDKSFDVVLAFGLYHNIENGLNEAIGETRRVLVDGGSLCASFRADNIQTKVSDWLSNKRSTHNESNFDRNKVFHKLNLTKNELIQLFIANGFSICEVSNVVNMPIFYKFGIFRHREHKVFNEHLGRTEGYRLSKFGYFLQKIAMVIAPSQFCNIYVILAIAE